MFCELSGEVVSAPIRSGVLKFKYRVQTARDIEIEGLGNGNPDCHHMLGRVISVVLEEENAGDIDQIVKGAIIILERYELDVVNANTGAMIRSVKHIRTDI